MAYELVHGPIPAGLTLHHTCGVKVCCNPAHLVPMTRADHSRMHHVERWNRPA